MKAAFGLGNPGPQYRQHRHNAGWMACASFLRSRSGGGGTPITTEEHQHALAHCIDDVLIVEPRLYMNLSGLAVREIVDRYELPLEGCLIVYDDAALPFGSLRARAQGGAGGHHGMESVIAHLGTERIPRLRLGIGGAVHLTDLTGHVLSDFSAEESAQLPAFLARAADAIDCFFQRGLTAVMQTHNSREQ